MVLQELRSPHPTVLVLDTLFFRHSFTRKTGEPLMARTGVQQDKKSIIQPETTLQVMERGFGNPDVQQNSPRVARSRALDAPMLMVPSLQTARAE